MDLPCPGQPALEEFLLGRSVDGAVEDMHAHIACCAGCQLHLSRALAADQLILNARMPNERQSQFDAEPELAAAIQQLANMNVHFDTSRAADATTIDPPPNNSPLLDGASLGNEEPSVVGDKQKQFGEYRILGEIARGGMGVVLCAVDSKLKREVAIKTVIATKKTLSTFTRFERESQIAARLSHPSIPPVHRLDNLEDGSPYLVMKLIKGETLGSLLAARNSPGTELGRFLQIFEQVSQAVGFAHTQGIVHRDLKPSNVMVGEFGEVQVMDWGLAKILSESDSCDGGVENNAHVDAAATQFGTIMGSPSFMSPEQARGETVSTSSDVFSLGAILCMLLTGEAPFADKGSSSDIIRSTALEDLADVMLKLDHCGGDSELIDLAKRCLAPLANDRPQTAGEVARAIATHRHQVAQRLQTAEAQRAASEARAIEQSKRRRLAMVAVALVTFALAAGAVAALSQARRATQAERATRIELGKTEAAKREADVARDQARERYDIALEAFTGMVSSLQKRLANEPGMLELRKELLANARVGLTALLESDWGSEPDIKLIWAHIEMAKLDALYGDFDAVMRNLKTAQSLAQTHLESAPGEVAALQTMSAVLAHLGDEEMRVGNSEKAFEYYTEEVQFDRRLVESDTENEQHKRSLSVGLGRLGHVALQHGQVEAAHQHYLQKRDMAEQLASAHPQNDVYRRDLAVSHEYVGNSASYLGDLELARKSYLAMHKVMRQRLTEKPNSVVRIRDVFISLTKLGEFSTKNGEPESAIEFFGQAAAMQEQLVELDGQNIQHKLELFVSYDNLGFTEFDRMEYEKAVAWFRKGLVLIQPLHDQGMLVGQFKEALAATQEQIDLCEKKLLASTEKCQ